MQSHGWDLGVEVETAETERDGFQGELECPLASLAAQVDKWDYHGIPSILSNGCELARGSYRLGVTAILKECKHNPNALWKSEHFFVGL